MTTIEIANRLVQLCRKGQWEKAQKELYSKEAVSIESYESSFFDKEAKGLHAILEKGRKFRNKLEKIHELIVSDPMVATNLIAFTMDMDVSLKGNKREVISELCVFQVMNGKIVKEEFLVQSILRLLFVKKTTHPEFLEAEN